MYLLIFPCIKFSEYAEVCDGTEKEDLKSSYLPRSDHGAPNGNNNNNYYPISNQIIFHEPKNLSGPL